MSRVLKIHKVANNTLPDMPSMFMHREDSELPDWEHQVRPTAPTPAVFPLLEQNVIMTREWQFYLVAINPGMELRRVSAILEYHRAFANGTGFEDPADPRADFILRRNLTYPLPAMDKVRTCARSTLKGTLSGTSVTLDMLNGNEPPPLKPGFSHPLRVEDVNPEAYLYLPQTHPWYFFAANIVQADGRLIPFPNGASYTWVGDNTPRTFVPHVSRFTIVYPLSRLVPVTSPPYPYRN